MTPKILLQKNNLLRKQRIHPNRSGSGPEEQPTEKTENDPKDTPPEEQPAEKTENDLKDTPPEEFTY